MNKPVHLNTEDYIASLIVRARQAQNIASGYSQKKVDELVTAIVWNIVKDGPAQEISQMAVDESRMGNYESKYAKLMTKCKGTLRDMKGKKSVGIIEVDEEKGIFKVAKPVGVVAGILPCTNPEATPVIKAIMAIKTRNAIILAPHPRTKKTNTHIVNIIRTTLKKYNAPEDLVVGIEEPTLESTNELMKQCDLVVATGGGALVKSAYSSGTPAYGVGQGNSVVVVDETADLKDAANKVMRSKTFDFATSCSTENSLVIQKKIYAEFIACLKAEGGYLLSPEQKAKLQQAMWVDHHLNAKIIAQSVQTIASVAGINIPEDCKFIMVEESQIGPEAPFSGEKLSMVVALFQYDHFQEAIDHVNEITNYHGRGHSCGIHSFNEEHIKQLALATKTSRIMVRQPQCLANSGAWTNGMPMTLTLGCGTWGGNASSSNITWKDLLNITWVSSPIEHNMPTDEEIFGEIMLKNK
ncbi:MULTISPECIES: aldehyde dehydrogenase family protein [Pelosinus]|uniref:Aldehyde Dehydrogenase n=1 Tax=Pelosinus fermentans B4 TaxID=1149862 RepID=I9B5V6_9FIRM|nr:MULTISPECIES: aldehyde dehydrogenase family protein [Pelosinus]EIW20507.1 Aldehyde Dehydrogenase [Pelosinus fermentans B4]EIW25778.1 acyl-CoA reductase [Pelosinus fermentans A11]OAM93502.1 Acetaldehyde dehydrogenase (acetylating) [Pelosinus fermentans DSM 17108]SDQ80039.1 sulfoacetaldehyde dehydrogenase [Pelosinus fermentans]